MEKTILHNNSTKKHLSVIEKNQENDLEFVRDTYLDLLEKSRESIELMMELAKESESPRVFEVLSNSIKSTSEITEKLVALHEANSKLQLQQQFGKDPSSSASIMTTNNNLYVGSTADLQKMLKEMSPNNGEESHSY